MTEPDNHLCVIGNRPHPAEAGHLCRGHYGSLADTIRDIVIQTEQLSAIPSMAISHGGKGSNLASHRAPARLDVIVLTDPRRGIPGLSDHSRDDQLAYDATDSSLNVLESWARIIREERGLTTTGAATVTQAAQTLTKHLEWIAWQSWVDEAYDELRKHLSGLKRTNGDPDDKPIGKCYLPQHDGICNGPIWLDQPQAIASCGHCGESWTGTQLAHLNWELEMARRPHIDGQPMKTVAELATIHRTTHSAMRKRLNRNGANSVDGYYDPNAAQESAIA